MSRFTKAERNLIYIKALQKYIGGYDDGICCAITRVIHPNPDVNIREMIPETVTEEAFPELFNKKPIGADKWNYWFDTADERIEVLKQLIAETE